MQKLLFGGNGGLEFWKNGGMNYEWDFSFEDSVLMTTASPCHIEGALRLRYPMIYLAV
ncbi:MAG: hypothetical protein ACYC49_04745 [Ignavibacteriaceae bacterium]